MNPPAPTFPQFATPNPPPSTFHHLPIPPQNPTPNLIPPSPPNPSTNNNNNNNISITTTLSTLKNLIQLSQSTLHSLSSIIPTTPTTKTQCPFNPHHHIPPSSLFQHSLHCCSPSPPPPSLHFFYHNSPSVVTFPNPITHTNNYHIPLFLSPPSSSFENYYHNLHFSRLLLLPSEIPLIQKETQTWNDYPTRYSPSLRRALLSSPTKHLLIPDLVSTWVIVNSPLYGGIVIDKVVRDHILLLFRFCVRPIVSEAVGLVCSGMMGGGAGELDCPVLGQALMWFGDRLSILYGQVNGKLFAIHIFRQLVLGSSMNSLMFCEEAAESCNRDVEENDGEILVSQVEAAVAALLERALLEGEIRAIRYPRHLNNSQRMAEHEYVSKRANEERQKRADYKPIVEHDVLLWQRARNEERNISKSREELLAEERDYKRRRMSYRGKKMKRTTTQVMRDIIEVYMEEIKAAGGFGCSVDEAEAEKIAPESIPVRGISAEYLMDKRVNSSSAVNMGYPHSDRMQLLSHKSIRTSGNRDESPNDLKRYKRDSDRHHDVVKDENTDHKIHNKHDSDYYSRNPVKKRNNGHSSELDGARGKGDETQACKTYSSRSPERNYRKSYDRIPHDRVDQLSEDKVRGRRTSDRRSHRSDSVSHHEYKGRYDPSESRDM